MDPAAEATRGQRSAHSLAIGPVTAEPFISPLGFTMTPASPGLSLSDDDGRGDLLTEFGLTLLAGGNNHITNGSRGKTVKTTTNASDGDNIQILTSSVVGAVHDSGHWESQSGAELVAGSARTT
jgi:hypothetical protein